MIEFYNPVHIVSGKGCLQEMTKYIWPHCPVAKTVLYIHRGMDFPTSQAYQDIHKGLETMEVWETSFTSSNPDITELYSLWQTWKGKNPDLIVAVGGGSVLDVAKSLAVLLPLELNDIEDMRQAIERGGCSDLNRIPWIGVPTTAGTGSEVTPWATIWDKERNCKRSLHHKKNFAILAILDPVVSCTCPLRLTVSSALDALCHATESYWSKRNTEITRAFSLLSIQLIREHLEGLLHQPQEERLREVISRGSLYAGLAFSNTKTTICHAVSYPLTAKFGIPHGVAAACTLSAFMEYNKKAIPERTALLKAWNCKDEKEVEQWIEKILAYGGFPIKLREYGIREEDILELANRSFTKGRADNNPLEVTIDVVYKILQDKR